MLSARNLGDVFEVEGPITEGRRVLVATRLPMSDLSTPTDVLHAATLGSRYFDQGVVGTSFSIAHSVCRAASNHTPAARPNIQGRQRIRDYTGSECPFETAGILDLFAASKGAAGVGE